MPREMSVRTEQMERKASVQFPSVKLLPDKVSFVMSSEYL
jgi:hypothetical protein